MTEEQKNAGEQKPAVGQMLPGIAGICLFMLFLTIMNVFGALRNAFGSGITKYGVLSLCTLLVVGIFGLLRMRRWGWSLVLAGCVLLFTGYFFAFEKTHFFFYLIQGLFLLVFFLYLVRDEVRSRLR